MPKRKEHRPCKPQLPGELPLPFKSAVGYAERLVRIMKLYMYADHEFTCLCEPGAGDYVLPDGLVIDEVLRKDIAQHSTAVDNNLRELLTEFIAQDVVKAHQDRRDKANAA